MHLSEIKLRDWKVFASAKFDFPTPSENKNICLVGAKNGFGKTSLFEAIVLALFGRDGMAHIARSAITSDPVDTKKNGKKYNKYMEKAIHRGKIGSGENSCSVKLVFVDIDDEPLEIRRVWHFSETGEFLPSDEHVEIYEGLTRKPIGPRGQDVVDKIDWYRDYISHRILPFELSKFFMFDGEQVSELAEREMSGQVRHGIEGLLGIPLLKKLSKNLRDYAEMRSRSSSSVSDKTIEKLQADLNTKTKDREKKEGTLNDIKENLFELKQERDKLVNELASLGAGTQDLLQEKFESIKNFEKNIEQLQSELEELLLGDIALALTGSELQNQVIKQMNSENIREKWENAKNQGDKKLDFFTDKFLNSLDKIEPILTDKQRDYLEEKIRESWIHLWYPPPDDCAKSIVHGYLKDYDRTNVVANLTELNSLGQTGIVQLLNDIEENKTNLKRLSEEVRRTESVAPQVDEKVKRLDKLNDEIQKLTIESGDLEREITGLEGQINNISSELNQQVSYFEKAKPSIRRISRANRVASLIDDLVANAVPSQISAIEREMTNAHKSMSHKKDVVDEIKISDNCEVKLLDSEKTDLRNFDLSAGEKQIFTQALLSAVSTVSQRKFPLIIDTPLGRLDVEHRKGLLKHLTNRNGQVLLLSTDTEVVDEYFNEIESHVQKSYKLQYQKSDGIEKTSIHEGYFD